ncbi:hypothetical protein HG536_0E04930 [Torulaspora globosa]|uniref:GPI mannosyltransferase 1 n=1 Tax=Torulaspora globosa TaxID=48254 RepID=A0A7G3ZJ96_9SACH|nr:uncharacterized protein HG536_0E04930 [Torulaspora globosa]QLL33582.1 hypothetical protein HG536_0E04930 [Torulaspora globosa]
MNIRPRRSLERTVKPTRMLSNGKLLIIASLLVRVGFFLYGLYQDANYKVKYTDIDYLVFHDAAGYVYEAWKEGRVGSPYQRDTYRYTPLLSWLLVPDHYFEWFHLGKLVFVAFDLLTGIIILDLVKRCLSRRESTLPLWLSSLWLLNPMVITISTRGNAESVVSFLIMLTLLLLQKSKDTWSAVVYGLSIHFKIYPIIYCLPIAIFLYHRNKRLSEVIAYGFWALVALVVSSAAMYKLYGSEFLQHAYWYHLYRTDHRHNFSLWNLLLYYDSARSASSWLSKFAFLPQMATTMALSVLQWRQPSLANLLNVLFLQTFAFVTYNKVCTSQYFVWYLIFLPFYIANTNLSWQKGVCMAAVWVITQAFWLLQGYLLEFEGRNVFFPGLLSASALFFIGNVWILGQFIDDINTRVPVSHTKKHN